MQFRIPSSSCRPLVVRIFTDMSISPSLSPRECPDHCAFCAGWNLPDKEFHYLRTVIVTAAVHRGFGRWLPCHQVTNFHDLPALGRYPLVEGRSSFSWEYGMGYFSALAPVSTNSVCDEIRLDRLMVNSFKIVEITDLYPDSLEALSAAHKLNQNV
ncbi:hypothetical protein M5K25_003847 [Dendrobium thyrsiflorum]|uniref:Uncharacterized protein n=1 Tax=Dendrobium thyrsiflorum TaxID=117978 RepID=A0ABD0VSJ0_DENTH